MTWDTTAGPSVTVNQAAGQADPTAVSPINFTVVFSQAVTGFDTTDLTFGGTATGTKTAVISGSGPTYNVAVSGMTSSGTVIVSIPAERVVGTSGGHPNLASTSTDAVVSFVLPSKWIVTPSSTTPIPGAAITITAQLADASNVPAPLSGVVVTWSSTNGGSFSSATSTTNASGVATVTFTVSTVAGTVHTVTATGNSVTGTSANVTVTLNPASITLTATSHVITWSQTFQLLVHFAGAGGANRAFQMQKSLSPNGGWTSVGCASNVTNAFGDATCSYRPATNDYYRVNFAGATDMGAALSNVERVVVRQIDLLRPTSLGRIKHITKNTTITFTATVRPDRPELVPPAHVTFVVYKLVGHTWTQLVSRDLTIDSSGRASLSVKFSSTGEFYVRSIARPTHFNANSVWGRVERYSVR